MAIFLKPMIFVIEIVGLLIKHFVLGRASVGQHVRRPPGAGGDSGFHRGDRGQHFAVWYGVTPASVFGATALNLLELFVAFLQAYIFAFLSALFIGMAVHQH